MIVDKYDRQIRLWGVKGQRRLGRAKVALVGCSGSGIQALKNLVLPGIGQIHIWDNTNITVQDLASSFFYEHTAVSTPKCEQALKNLLEMNTDVSGKSFNKSLKQFLLNQNKELVDSYSLIIFGNNLTPSEIKETSTRFYETNIPCIYILNIGHYFYIRLQKKSHFVESSNSQAAKKYSLSIDNPFQYLEEYASKRDLIKLIQKANKEKQEKPEDGGQRQILRIIGNLPYPIVLIHVYKNLSPQNRNRKGIQKQLKEIKELVHEKYRDNINEALTRILDVFQTADNFMNNFYLINPSNQDKPLEEIAKKLPESTKAWPEFIKFLFATQQFYTLHKKLPQPTNLPDMHTTTQSYLELKSIYKKKHQQDIQQLIKLQKKLYPNDQIIQKQSIQNISEYINNIENLDIIRMRSYTDQLQNPENPMFPYCPTNQQCLYLVILAYQQYLERKGQQKINLSKFDQLKEICVNDILKTKFKGEILNGYSEQEKQNNMKLLDKYLTDICRSQGINSNINISSMAGAIAAQQAIKLISGCFTPMNSGYIFDGAHGAGYTISF